MESKKNTAQSESSQQNAEGTRQPTGSNQFPTARQDSPVHPNNGNTIKDPDDWSTGDEAMTGAQRSYLHTLATEAGEQPEEGLSKAEASKKIDELQHKTGRGLKDTE